MSRMGFPCQSKFRAASIWPLALALFAGTDLQGESAPGTPVINRTEIQALYISGDFEPLIALLEHIRHQRSLRDREDSIFIFKYLGVMYGADEATRKKAESFLYQLLKLNPGADLEDMGVNDRIDTLFQRVRERYAGAYRDTTFQRNRLALERKFTAGGAATVPARLERMVIPASLAAADTGGSDPGAVASAAKPPLPVGESRPEQAGGTAIWMWASAGGFALAAAWGTAWILSSGPAVQIDTILTQIR